MVKLLVVSHGPLADAIKESARMFFGNAVENITSIGLYPQDDPMALQEKIGEAINNADEGDGVLIFVDIFAGTPFNMTALSIDDLKETHQMECFTGVNLPVLMETLGYIETMALPEIVEKIEEVGPTTITNLRKALDI